MAYCTDPYGRDRQAIEFSEDGIGGFGPGEGLRVVVVLVDTTVAGGLEVDDGAEDAACREMPTALADARPAGRPPQTPDSRSAE